MNLLLKIAPAFFLPLFLGAVFLWPAASLGQEIKKDDTLVFCNTVFDEKERKFKDPCTFGHLADLVNRTVRFFILYLFLPIATVSFIYAGGMMIFQPTNSSARGLAQKILWNLLLSSVFVLCSWLIVILITNALGASKEALIFIEKSK